MLILGHPLKLPRRPWMFRSRYQPQRLLHDVTFGLFIASIALGITFFGSWAWSAARHKEACPRIDAKHNIGIDENGKLCKRRPG